MAKQIYIDENGNPIEVSGTINTAELLPISGNDPTDTKSYIDTGLSGKADTNTVPKHTTKTVSITANSYVSPFTAYGNVSISDLSGYTIVGYMPYTNASTNPICCCIEGNALHCYGRGAGTITVEILYI